MDGTPQLRDRKRTEFGDFQTPPQLALAICQQLARTIPAPRSVIEPTCGLGAFLVAAATVFPRASPILGVDVNSAYLNAAIELTKRRRDRKRFQFQCGDSLRMDWSSIVSDLAQPILVVGNPPWVTNAQLGQLDGKNLPHKSNVDARRGIEALTGKSNFDISESLLRHLLKSLDGRQATLAMLCKNSVARKLLAWSWDHEIQVSDAATYAIDAELEFGAAVDACLFVCDLRPRSQFTSAAVYNGLTASTPTSRIGRQNGTLIANQDQFERSRHLLADRTTKTFVWRSGVKHDCASVLELREQEGHLWNKLGERVDIEPECLFPLLKSSDVAKGDTKSPRRWLIVPQRTLGEDTAALANTLPRTWKYLLAHADRFDARRSSIYREQPRFSVFGIGDYTFAPWKVAVSGFYKRLLFSPVGRFCGKPIVLDDTCYFVSCRSRRESHEIVAALNSSLGQEFFSSLIFWDAKRPITADLLRLLDLFKLRSILGDRPPGEGTANAALSKKSRKPDGKSRAGKK